MGDIADVTQNILTAYRTLRTLAAFFRPESLFRAVYKKPRCMTTPHTSARDSAAPLAASCTADSSPGADTTSFGHPQKRLSRPSALSSLGNLSARSLTMPIYCLSPFGRLTIVPAPSKAAARKASTSVPGAAASGSRCGKGRWWE